MEQDRDWKKSSYSGTTNGVNCVEVATAGSRAFVRDSQNKGGRELGFSLAAWETFGTQVKTGTYDV